MKKRLALAAALAALLAGCSGQKYQESPLGIGSGPNDLKQSPCACMSLGNTGQRSS